jgi:hypothetical protein
MINRIIILIVTSFTLSQVYIVAQTTNDSIDSDQLQLNSTLESSTGPSDVILKNNLKIKRLSTSLEAGTSFSYSPHNYYGPSFYIAPGLNYSITPRFNLQAGIIVEKSTLYGFKESDLNTNSGLNLMSISLYARGSYLLTPKLVVHGTVYKTINDVPKQLKYQVPGSYNSNGAIVGINYKINRSLSIGFDVRMQNNSYYSGNQGYYYPVLGY